MNKTLQAGLLYGKLIEEGARVFRSFKSRSYGCIACEKLLILEQITMAVGLYFVSSNEKAGCLERLSLALYWQYS